MNENSKLSSFLGVVAIGLCTFMQVLDYSIANVSIASISGDLAVPLNNGTWVITMFAIGNAISIPLTGYLITRFGSVKTMYRAVILFTIVSFICGCSININMLVVSRFIQGFAAGPILPLAQGLMFMSFPREKRNLAITLVNMIAIVGPVLGPIAGGWITYNYSWPWIFFINIPIGIFCFFTIKSVYATYETPCKKIKIDKVGLIALATAVSTLQILLDQGEQLDWWNSKTIWALTITSILSFIFLIIWEIHKKNPIINLHFFKDKNFSIGTIIVSISYMVIFGVILITPLWMQEILGYTSFLSGLALSTVGIIPFFTVVFVSKLMDKLPIKYFLLFSFAILSSVLFLFSTFNIYVTFKEIATSRLILGAGLATLISPLIAITFTNFPSSKVAAGQSVFHFFRIIMGAVGTAFFFYIWNRRANYHHSTLVDFINPYRTANKFFIGNISKAKIFGKKVLFITDKMVWQKAYTLSANDLFWIGGSIFLIFFFVVLFFIKHEKLKSSQ